MRGIDDRVELGDRADQVRRAGDRHPSRALVDERDHVGRIEGRIARVFPGGFAMIIDATPRKREKLADQLTWLTNRYTLNLPEDRRHEREAPAVKTVELGLPDGRSYRCRVIDLSMSGAAIAIDVKPAIGTPISLGKIRGRVVRHMDGGIAVEFAVVQTRESLSLAL